MILLLLLSQFSWGCEATFLNGVLTTSEPLEMLQNDAQDLSQSTKDCLLNIGLNIQNLTGFRQLTIAFAVDNEHRGQAMKSAQKFVDILSESGISRPRISYTFPRAMDGENKITIAYSAKTSNIQVAAIAGMSGTVRVGATRTSLVPSSVGQKIAIGTFIETGSGSFANILLVDGSKIRLEENSLVRIDKIQKDENGQRDISLSLDYGSFETDVSQVGGQYQIRTEGGIAGVRGTRFRVVAKEQQDPNNAENADKATTLEKLKKSIPEHLKNTDEFKKKTTSKRIQERVTAKTLQITTYEGNVALGNLKDGLQKRTDSTKNNSQNIQGIEDEILVSAGFFSETNADGQSQPNPPQEIPMAPTIFSPRQGQIKENSLFSWSEAHDEEQTTYIIEVARDAGFSIGVQQYFSSRPNLFIRGGIAPGDWYWRVAAINEQEVRSDWSMTFGFFMPYTVQANE